MSNSLDPDQARRIAGPDLGPNCLPRLSADDTGRQRVKSTVTVCRYVFSVGYLFSHSFKLYYLYEMGINFNLTCTDNIVCHVTLNLA